MNNKWTALDRKQFSKF